MMRSRAARRAMGVAAAAVLVLAACTGDDDDSAATTAAETGASTSAGGAGPTTSAGETTTTRPAATTTAGATTTAAPGAATTVPAATAGQTLARVQAADTVKCGSRRDLPGFATVDASGAFVGFDVDFCKAVAAAVLGDATKAEPVAVETADRFTALSSGEIDVLIRNTTWTATRDGLNGATFLHTTFYDGQGMMVGADSGFESLEDLSGAVVCVVGGTTTEGNVATEFARLALDPPEVLSFPDTNAVTAAFSEDRCDGWSSDQSQLIGLRANYPGGPEALVILDEVFSKEPLSPAVRDGDSQWAQIVDWATLATIQAEEFGITQANVDQMRETSTNPSVKQFLGVQIDNAVLDPGLGLPTDFAYQIVKQVGNYGEIYERNLGPLGIPRGVNSLWTDGGLLYAPPYR